MLSDRARRGVFEYNRTAAWAVDGGERTRVCVIFLISDVFEFVYLKSHSIRIHKYGSNVKRTVDTSTQ